MIKKIVKYFCTYINGFCCLDMILQVICTSSWCHHVESKSCLYSNLLTGESTSHHFQRILIGYICSRWGRRRWVLKRFSSVPWGISDRLKFFAERILELCTLKSGDFWVCYFQGRRYSCFFFFGSFLWGNIKQVGFTWMYPENSREQAAARMAGGCCVCFHVVAVNISWGFGRCDVKWGPEQLLHSGHLPEQQMVWNLSRGHKSVHYILSEDFSHKGSCWCPENTKEKAVVFHTVVHVGDKRTLVFWSQTSLSPH